MTAPPLCVETDLDLAQIADHEAGEYRHDPALVPAVLRWEPADPWVVRLEFLGRGITWEIGWEMLARASDPAVIRTGLGDVVICRPTARDLEVTLSSPDGSATFLADPLDLVAFVACVRPRQQAAARPWIPATAHELLDAIHTAHEETR